MSDPYERAKGGRLAFKGGVLASRSKSIDKKKKKKTKKNDNLPDEATEFISDEVVAAASDGEEGSTADQTGGEIYTIDAAKRMKYEQLFPVETKKFGYDPKFSSKTVEDALDDRVKKKADRYCK